MTVNPLVAARVDQPADVWSGVWIAEDIELIGQGVRSGSWIDTGLGVVGAGLDGLAMVSDPVGVLLQYGVAWIIEHVRPLTQALDWLAGDPGQIAGHAQTWRNVAASLTAAAEEAARAVRWDVADWGGSAGPAYRDWAGQQHAALGALGKAAETMAAITEGAGMLVAAVRMLVRDAIATCVSRLVTYAAEEGFSLGLATPLVVEQVSTLVASWAAKIAKWLKDMLSSLRRLEPVVQWLDKYIEKIKEILSKLWERVRPGRKTGSGGKKPEVPEDPPKKIGGPKEFDPQELHGLTPDEVKARIPDDWTHNPSARGGGEVFADPANRGRQIRIMPGYPPHSRPDPLTWGPYAVVSQGGKPPVKIPLAGNPTLI